MAEGKVWVETALDVTGLMVNHPPPLLDVNKLLMGYWPDVYHQLYGYNLVFGGLPVFLSNSRNIHCH